jgi:hypothetical protein
MKKTAFFSLLFFFTLGFQSTSRNALIKAVLVQKFSDSTSWENQLFRSEIIYTIGDSNLNAFFKVISFFVFTGVLELSKNRNY